MKKPIAILLIAAIITLAVATCALPLAACATTNNQETSILATAMPALAQGSKGTPSESDSSSMEFTTNARGYVVTKNEEDLDILQMVVFSYPLSHDDTTLPYNSSDNIQNGGDLHTLKKISSGSKPPVKVSKQPEKVSEPPVKVSKQSPVHNINTCENFASIQAAIDDSDTLNGHTITVDAGTYTENVAVNKRLTIRSENGADVTVVQAATLGDVIEVTASFVTISGFTVTGATGACGGICLNQVDHCNICDNKVLHNDVEGIRVTSSFSNTLSSNDCFYNGLGIVLCLSNSNTLSDNDCSDNYYGIRIASSNDNELKSNIRLVAE